MTYRMCFDCGDKPARWPKSDPAFCTKTHAAEWGADWTANMMDVHDWPCLDCADGTRGYDCVAPGHRTEITVGDMMLASIRSGDFVRGITVDR